MVAKQPLVKRNLAALEHGAHGHGELFAAIVALDETYAVFLADKAGRIERATVRARRTLGPTQALKILASLGFVSELQGGEVRNAPIYAATWAALSSI